LQNRITAIGVIATIIMTVIGLSINNIVNYWGSWIFWATIGSLIAVILIIVGAFVYTKIKCVKWNENKVEHCKELMLEKEILTKIIEKKRIE